MAQPQKLEDILAAARDNLCLCCPTCNRYKAARTRAAEPMTGEPTSLFHPTRDVWEDHFATLRPLNPAL
jgi:hypothetical protein